MNNPFKRGNKNNPDNEFTRGERIVVKIVSFVLVFLFLFLFVRIMNATDTRYDSTFLKRIEDSLRDNLSGAVLPPPEAEESTAFSKTEEAVMFSEVQAVG